MLTNKCFVLEFITPSDHAIHKYTQKYELINASIFASGVIVTYESGGTSIATLCSDENTDGICNPLIKILSQFDCNDVFTGDFYGDGIFLGSSLGHPDTPFPFVRFSWLQGMIRKLPTNIKRTVSVNCRTQRTERTNKYLLTAFVSFPLWKMEEIEGMMLANHLFVGDKQYQSEGGTPFEQVGKPKNCVYAFKLGMELQDCFEWQTFGCTPPCTPLISYYPIAF